MSFFQTLKYATRWLLLAFPVGILSGSASAVLIVSLNWATTTREAHPWIVALLPFAGLVVGLLYHYAGRSVEAGNNLIVEEIHREAAAGRSTIPFRMTPLVLLGTTLTHLCGGSAGREGTALQTGASLADQVDLILSYIPRVALSTRERRTLLMAGLSGGFASVFGTPLAGAVFGLEVLTIGTVEYNSIYPCFLAAFGADLVTRAWRVHHTLYAVSQFVPFTPRTMLWAIAAGIIFGTAALLFARTTHILAGIFKRIVPYPPLRPFLGGAMVAAAVFSLGFVHTRKYLGLGIPTILAAFSEHLPPYDFAAKFAFTTVTLAAGFKGGEVTPLFFIGAALGNTLSNVIPLPSSLLAAMGFVAVFAGAANTPIASSLMAMELFGPEVGAFAAVACVTSYLFSGEKGIYHAQRLGVPKATPALPAVRSAPTEPHAPLSDKRNSLRQHRCP